MLCAEYRLSRLAKTDIHPAARSLCDSWTTCKHLCEGVRSNNFIIGLTDVSPTVTAPTLLNYAVCGQYQGPVADGATVSLRCTSKHLYYQPHLCRSAHLRCTSSMSAYRYVILQFLMTGYANFCELEVYIRCKLLYGKL